MNAERSTRHIVAVVQADSTAAAERALGGLAASRLVGRIALVAGPGGESVVEFGRARGLTVIRCPGDDFLVCFARAAELLDADIVVRVGRDAMLDAGLVDHLVAEMIAQGCDLILPAEADAAQAAGVEAFTRLALDKLLLDVAADPAATRQPTRYFMLHPGFAACGRAAPYRCTKPGGKHVGDVGFVDGLRARLDANGGEATLDDLLTFAQREGLKVRCNPRSTALIRVESRGLGRARRMIMLAHALRDRENIDVAFSVVGSAEMAAQIRQAGFEVSCSAGILPEGRPVPDLLVVDGGVKNPAAVGARIVAVIEDYSDRRLSADFAFYSPLPQAFALDWGGSGTVVRAGWEWTVPGLAPSQRRPKGRLPRPTVLVSMGASDVHGLTLRVAKALALLDPVFRARFVIGPGFEKPQRLANTMVGLRSNFETIEGAQGLATEFAACDLAITGVGVTACELAACGVPALYLCTNDREALAASAYEHAGFGICLGSGGGDIAGAVWSLFGNAQKRREIGVAGPLTIDGAAAHRIASDLAAALAAGRESRRVMR